MRACAALALVVVGHAALVPAVDLHVGGVQVNRDRLAQRDGALGRHQRQHHRLHRADPGLRRPPLAVGEPPGQPRRSRRAQPGHRRKHLPSGIGAVAV